MVESDVIKLVNDMLVVTIKIAAPMLGISMVVGLIISILQTTTSIQEQTLTFVPKALAVGIAMAVFFAYILNTAMDYTVDIYNLIQKF